MGYKKDETFKAYVKLEKHRKPRMAQENKIYANKA